MTQAELEIIIRARDEASAALNKTGEQLRAMGEHGAAASPKVDAAAGAVTRVSGAATTSSTSFVSMAGSFGLAQLGADLLGSAVDGLAQFLRGSVESAIEAERSQSKLAQALKQAGLATPEVKKQYGDLASEFQRTTTISDELVTETQALLTQVGGVMPSQMGAAVRAAADLSRGLGVDLRTATMLVAKAFNGHTETLVRYGIEIEKSRFKTEGASVVLEAINKQFGGQAQAEVETYGGRVERFANQWDNVKEAVGRAILSFPILESAMRTAESASSSTSDAADRSAASWDDVASVLAATPFTAWIGNMMDASKKANELADAAERISRIPSPFKAMVDAGAFQPINTGLAVFNASLADGVTLLSRTHQRVFEWDAELSRAAKAGGLPALKRALDDNALSTREISEATGVSEGAIKRYAASLKSGADAAKAHAKAQKDAADESVRSTAINTKAINEWLDNLAEHAANVQAESRRTQEAITATLRASLDQSQSALLANVKTRLDAEREAGQLSQQMALSERDYKIAMIHDEINARIAALGLRKAGEDQAYDSAVDALNRLRALQIAQVTDSGGWWTRMADITRDTFGQLQTALSGTFAQMMLGAKSFSDGFKDIWSSLKASLARIFAEIADTFVSGMLKRMLAGMQGQQSSFAGGFAGLLGTAGSASGANISDPNTFIGPIQGGTNWGAIAGGGLMAAGGLYSLMKAQGVGNNVVSGATTGAGVGTMIAPGIGTAIGAGAGALVGLMKGLFGGGNSAGRQADADATGQIGALQAKLLETYGSLGKIQELGAQVGVDLAGAWGDKSRTGLVHFTGLVEQFEKKLGDQNARLAEQKAIQTDITSLEGQIAAAKASQIPTWQQMNGIIQQYGIDVKGLGNAVQQMKINDMSRTYLDAFTAMKAGGADATGVLAGMADEFSGLVREAMSYGVEIPENMKPVIESLAEQGRLTDANGTKITDLTKIKWGAPVETEADKVTGAIKAMVEKLDELMTKLLNLPTTSGEAAGRVSKQWEKAPWEDWPRMEFPSGEGGGSPDVPGYASGAYITRPHAAVVGEGGEPELIGPVSFMTAALQGAIRRVGPSAAHSDSREVAATMRAVQTRLDRLPADIARAIRDGLMLAGGR